MQTLWPWLTILGLGALHGLSPANGWMFAAACGVRARDDARAWRALLPIAIGHTASIAIVVFAVTQGVLMDRTKVQSLAGIVLIGLASYLWLRGVAHAKPGRTAAGTRASHIGIAFWSCLMSTAHGAGLMLVPALVPLCMSDSPAREITASGSIVLALAAVAVHLAAMLATTGAIATGICRGVAAHPRWSDGAALRHVWASAQAVIGASLISLS